MLCWSIVKTCDVLERLRIQTECCLKALKAFSSSLRPISSTLCWAESYVCAHTVTAGKGIQTHTFLIQHTTLCMNSAALVKYLIVDVIVFFYKSITDTISVTCRFIEEQWRCFFKTHIFTTCFVLFFLKNLEGHIFLFILYILILNIFSLLQKYL